MLSKAIQAKAITKALNKTHGKTVGEQAEAIIEMLADFEELFTDMPMPDTQPQYVAQATAAAGAFIRTATMLGTLEELPMSLSSPTNVMPIDGRNYRSVAEIMEGLYSLPVDNEIEVNGALIKCHRNIVTAGAIDRMECVELRYVPEGFTHTEVKFFPVHKFRTTDSTFTPWEKLDYLLKMTKDMLEKTLNVRAGNINVHAVPPPRQGPEVITQASDFSASSIKGIDNFDKNWNSEPITKNLFSR